MAATGQRYQGVVPLEGAFADGRLLERYFAQSEQVPTLIRTADSRRARRDHRAAACWSSTCLRARKAASGCTARMDHPEWEHVTALAGSLGEDELVDAELSLEAIVWRLFHEEREVRVRWAMP